jgi:hypothetical protein
MSSAIDSRIKMFKDMASWTRFMAISCGMQNLTFTLHSLSAHLSTSTLFTEMSLEHEGHEEARLLVLPQER